MVEQGILQASAVEQLRRLLPAAEASFSCCLMLDAAQSVQFAYLLPGRLTSDCCSRDCVCTRYTVYTSVLYAIAGLMLASLALCVYVVSPRLYNIHWVMCFACR